MVGSWWKANPFFGEMESDAWEYKALPGCLEDLLKEDVLPRAKRDRVAEFRTRLKVGRDGSGRDATGAAICLGKKTSQCNMP